MMICKEQAEGGINHHIRYFNHKVKVRAVKLRLIAGK